MGLLLVSCRWWRYPVKAPKARTLDHTKLTGKLRAIYPVRKFSKAECAAHAVEEAKGHYGPLIEIKKGERAGEVNRGYPVRPTERQIRIASKAFKKLVEDVWQTRVREVLHLRAVRGAETAPTVVRTRSSHDWRFKPLGRLACRAHCPPIRARLKAPAGRSEACKLVIPGTWTFLGADRHYSERWKFTETPKRKARPVPLRFKGGWDRLHNLPAWRGASLK